MCFGSPKPIAAAAPTTLGSGIAPLPLAPAPPPSPAATVLERADIAATQQSGDPNSLIALNRTGANRFTIPLIK